MTRKEELKLAKQAVKTGQPISVRTGILPQEEQLKPNTQIVRGHFYVIDHEGGLVVQSPVSGKIEWLKEKLRGLGYKFNRIFWCDFATRNITLPKQQRNAPKEASVD